MSRLTRLFAVIAVAFLSPLLLSGTHDATDTATTTPAPTYQPTAIEVAYAPVATPTPRPTPSPTQEPPQTQTEPTEPPEPPYSEAEIEMLAKAVCGEAGICSTDEQRLVIWTVLQRVDGDHWGDTISDVITAKWQFVGYHPNNPIDPDIYTLCLEELAAWWSGAEPPTLAPYATTAPYYYFDGDGRHNWYREEWK